MVAARRPFCTHYGITVSSGAPQLLGGLPYFCRSGRHWAILLFASAFP